MMLTKQFKIEMNFLAQGVDEKNFLENTEKIAYLAYEDQCSTANPRLPLVEDMKLILEKALYGKTFK